jgi:hypothetical protein
MFIQYLPIKNRALPMERQEDIRRLVAAYDAMDDRARRQQLRQFERAAEDHPREVAPPASGMGCVVPFPQVANRR